MDEKLICPYCGAVQENNVDFGCIKCERCGDEWFVFSTSVKIDDSLDDEDCGDEW